MYSEYSRFRSNRFTFEALYPNAWIPSKVFPIFGWSRRSIFYPIIALPVYSVKAPKVTQALTPTKDNHVLDDYVLSWSTTRLLREERISLCWLSDSCSHVVLHFDDSSDQTICSTTPVVKYCVTVLKTAHTPIAWCSFWFNSVFIGTKRHLTVTLISLPAVICAECRLGIMS